MLLAALTVSPAPAKYRQPHYVLCNLVPKRNVITYRWSRYGQTLQTSDVGHYFIPSVGDSEVGGGYECTVLLDTGETITTAWVLTAYSEYC